MVDTIDTEKNDKKAMQAGKWLGGKFAAIVVGIAVTAGAGIWTNYSSNKLRYFDTQIIASPVVAKRPNLPGFKMTVAGADVGNLYTVRVAVFNLTGKHYDGLPITLHMNAISPSEVLSSQLLTTDLVELQTSLSNQAGSPAGYHESYIVKVANSGRNAILAVDYVINTTTEPQVTVAIEKAGIEARQLDLAKTKQWSVPLGFALGTMMLVPIVMMWGPVQKVLLKLPDWVPNMMMLIAALWLIISALF